MAYSYRRVALFSKKASQERRISDLLDILNVERQSFQPHKIFMRVTCKHGGLIVVFLGPGNETNEIKGLPLR